MPGNQYLIFWGFIVTLIFYNINHDQRIYALEQQQHESILKLHTYSTSINELKDEHTGQIEQLQELAANAHLYIAVLENQAISIKEDIKQCERKKN